MCSYFVNGDWWYPAEANWCYPAEANWWYSAEANWCHSAEAPYPKNPGAIMLPIEPRLVSRRR